MKNKTFSIVSLGCFRNTYDSEIIARRFSKKDWEFLSPNKSLFIDKKLHTLIINTCGFIDAAKKESIEAIKEAVNLKKRGKIKKLLVYGCLVKRYKEELKNYFKEVDRWAGIEKFNSKFIERNKLTPSHIDFIKITEGCINKCSYCAIPLIKGTLKSKPLKEIIREVKFLDKIGIKELNIIGQDITSWGLDLGGLNLAILLKELLKATKNIPWIRLLYTHPKHITDELIDIIASEDRICKYIDLPIQHINDRILKLMNRKTTKKETISLIEKIRKKIPNIAIRSSVIVGFPSETKKEFKELLDFLKYIRFERLGAFMYSREEGTEAYKLSYQIPKTERKIRFNELMSLQRNIALEVNKRFVNKILDVLIEKRYNDIYIGRSQYDAYEIDGVVYLKKSDLKLANFYKAKIVDSYEYDLVGI